MKVTTILVLLSLLVCFSAAAVTPSTNDTSKPGFPANLPIAVRGRRRRVAGRPGPRPGSRSGLEPECKCESEECKECRMKCMRAVHPFVPESLQVTHGDLVVNEEGKLVVADGASVDTEKLRIAKATFRLCSKLCAKKEMEGEKEDEE